MKATGITRRIDNLGRIVIPKEIRTNLRIKTGDTLEIYVNQNQNIILKKYSQLEDIKQKVDPLIKAISEITKKSIIVTDRYSFLSTTPNLKDLENKPLPTTLQAILEERKTIIQKAPINLSQTYKINTYVTTPIITNGDLLGLIIVIDQNITQIDINLSQIIASFLSKNIEQ